MPSLMSKNVNCEAVLCLIQDQSIFSEEKSTDKIKYLNNASVTTKKKLNFMQNLDNKFIGIKNKRQLQ